MMRLIRVEMRRLWLRRFTKVALVLALLVVALSGYSLVSQLRPLGAVERAEGQRYFEDASRDFETNGAANMADCLESEADARAQGDANADFGCSEMEPKLEYFMRQPPSLATAATEFLWNLTQAIPFFAFVIGASGVAAEFATGALGTWLTFVPRRLRVLASKLIATPLLVGPSLAGVVAVCLGGSYAVASSLGADLAITTAEATRLAWVGVRLTVIAMLAAICGACLGALTRHTAAALGLAIGWGVAIEGIFRGIVMFNESSALSELQRWMILPNLDAWVRGGNAYQVQQCTTTASGLDCTEVDRLITAGGAGLYFGALTILLVLLTALVFRRRDVT